MKRSAHIFISVFITLGLLGPLATQARAMETVRVEVLLVRATDGGSGIDAPLRPYAGTLKRLFRFDSYELVSSRSMSLNLPGEAGTSLAGGQSLTLRAGPDLKADIDWMRGKQRLLHTRIQMRRGNPAILGGPRGREGTLLLILQLK